MEENKLPRSLETPIFNPEISEFGFTFRERPDLKLVGRIIITFTEYVFYQNSEINELTEELEHVIGPFSFINYKNNFQIDIRFMGQNLSRNINIGLSQSELTKIPEQINIIESFKVQFEANIGTILFEERKILNIWVQH